MAAGGEEATSQGELSFLEGLLFPGTLPERHTTLRSVHSGSELAPLSWWQNPNSDNFGSDLSLRHSLSGWSEPEANQYDWNQTGTFFSLPNKLRSMIKSVL